MPRYGGTPSTLNTPNHAIRATLVNAYRPPPRYIVHMDNNLHHGYRRQLVSCIRSRGRLDLSYDAGSSCGCREAGRYECCSYGVVWGVKSGGGPPVPRYSYGGHRVDLWRASDWPKNDKKRLKIKQIRQPRVYLGYIRPA